MHPLNLYIAAALMALVGLVCAVLCVVWSIPSWRRRLQSPAVANQVLGGPSAKALIGWKGHIGSVLISIGIAACAAVSWYGCYCVLAAMGVAAR